ncbi:transglycosylase domain-containing protein [Gammaproteobacteria bacterium]|jgi:penicillin-binding protein 1A|nr:transglycosylase domain-containing protein [Gammaproteobacteria bacterium]
MLFRYLAILSTAAVSGVVMVVCAAYLYLAPLLPSAETYRDVQLETPLRIYTRDGLLIDEIGNRRDPVEYEDIPQVLIDALIATEDARFYSHPGVDFQSLIRGFYGFIRGVNLGGGSTITMQLANNLSFDSDNVYLRKFKEIPFALQIQRELSKEEILTLYLNTIYFGAGADGIGAAAFVYYGKQPRELTLAEAAMMVSLLPCPSTCNPLSSPVRSIERRRTRLRNMLREGMISEAEFAAADAQPVSASRHNRNIEIEAPYIAEMVRQELYGEYGEAAYTQGFEVVTTLDSKRQRLASSALVDGLEDYYDRRHGYRGPTATFPPAAAEPTEALQARWLETLADVPAAGNQLPAIVSAVAPRSFTALLRDGEQVTVPWSGISWAYAFRSRNEAWPPPQVASDAVSVGDLVRLRSGEEGWELGQVPEIQGALVSMLPNTGEIAALVGGYDFRRSQVNRVLTPRPPGSNFKPFVYGAALEDGYTAATLINDAPLTRGDYRPNNFENNFLGPVTLRYALKESRNVPAVRLFDQLGSDKVFDFAKKFGLPVENFPRNDLTVGLGSSDVQPLEIVTAYSSLANGGYKVEPTFILEVRNLNGPIYKNQPASACADCEAVQNGESEAAPRIVDDRVAYILGTMLRSVVVEGSGARVQREIGRSDLMGKTGTTNGPRELWFSGFNADLATTVFVGFDTPEPLGEREQGATVAVPIWIDYMKAALEGTPERTMRRPDGIEDRLIDRETGEPALPGSSNAVFEFFRSENAPSTPARSTNSGAGDDGEVDATETIF